MFVILSDGNTVYAPTLTESGYIVTSPKLTKEVNKAGSLEFTLPATNPSYSDYSKMKSLITVEEDETEIWRGRISNDERDFYQNKAIFAEGELAFLNDVPYPPYDYSNDGVTIQTYLSTLLNYYNKNCSSYRKILLGTVSGALSTQLITAKSEEWSNILNDISKNVISQFGGYIVTRRDKSSNVTYLDYYNNQSNLSLQEIRFGENLLDLTESVDASEVYTQIIPLGKANQNGKRVDISSVNNGSNMLRSTTGVNLFGIITKVVTFDDVESPSELKTLGQNQLDQAIAEATIIEISAADLHRVGVDTDAIDAGQYVRVVSPPHGIDDHFLCTKIEIDLTNPENSRYTFGGEIPTITSSTGSVDIKIQQASNVFIDALREATAIINGAVGGYKLTEYDSEGKWLRDLYMDAPSKEQATNIMQINMGGIAFSQNGYGGPYNSAWTINGKFVADWITAGTMRAERIRGGILLSNNYVSGKKGIRFDLNNGALEANKFNLSDYLIFNGDDDPIPFELGGWQIKRMLYDTGLAEYWDTIGTQANGIGATGPWVVWGGWNGEDPFNPANYKFVVTEDGTCKAMDWITGSKAELKEDIRPYDNSGLEEVLKTAVYRYRLKNQSSMWKTTNDQKIGFVIGDGYPLSEDLLDGHRENIDIYKAIGIAYKAIQELSAQIDQLKEKLS